MNADLALEKLVEGNQRYVNMTASGTALTTHIERKPVDEGQRPFAIILSCSDSRVPPETIFHCGLGDLFAVRIAGNVVEPTQIGSVEFACLNFGTELVVVLGHSHCGAIKASVDILLGGAGPTSPNLASIVDQVTPAILPIVSNSEQIDHDELVHQSMRANVEQSVNSLTTRSPDLSNLVDLGKLKVIGADYSLETGVVDFYLDD